MDSPAAAACQDLMANLEGLIKIDDNGSHRQQQQVLDGLDDSGVMLDKLLAVDVGDVGAALDAGNEWEESFNELFPDLI